MFLHEKRGFVMKKKRTGTGLILFLFFWVSLAPALYANDARNLALIFRGVGRTVASAFSLPFHVLSRGTQSFPLGLVGGVMSGTYQTVTSVLGGGFDMARGAAPYAKYMAFL